MPRDIIIKVRVTPAENALITAAAQRSGLSAGAWIGDVCTTAAGQHAEPAGEIERQTLAELIRLSGLARKAGNLLNQAVAKLNATGQPGPDLAPAAAWVARVAADVDNASLAISDRMARSTRRVRQP